MREAKHNLHTEKVSKKKLICLSGLLQYIGQTLLGNYETATVHIKNPVFSSDSSVYTRGVGEGNGLLVLPFSPPFCNHQLLPLFEVQILARL